MSIERAERVRGERLEQAIGVADQPGFATYDFARLIIPTFDVSALVPVGFQRACLEVQTGALPAGAYLGTLAVRPQPGWALRILAWQMYLDDALAAAPTTPAPSGTLITPDFFACHLMSPTNPNREPGPNEADIGLYTQSAGTAGVPQLQMMQRADYLHYFLLYYDAGTTTPRAPVFDATRAYDLAWPHQGVVLAREDKQPAGAVVPLEEGLEFSWYRTAVLNDEDRLILNLYYSHAPVGLMPPL